ncbi:MAG: hypothetical protein WC730_00215 [Patescibacteria group bacterium]|jgi:hypothetical protein
MSALSVPDFMAITCQLVSGLFSCAAIIALAVMAFAWHRTRTRCAKLEHENMILGHLLYMNEKKPGIYRKMIIQVSLPEGQKTVHLHSEYMSSSSVVRYYVDDVVPK